ncbi:MAG: Y-family DNA polymerase, partial [Mycobacteriaceae bacterium]
MGRNRTLALWCPDWPAVTAAVAAGLPADRPVAVVSANRVVACTAGARAEGVRRGLRRREAQGRCPELHVAQV